MEQFDGTKRAVLKSEGTHEVLAVYPHRVEGTRDEVEKAVRDWYYQQSCGAEDELLTAYVDIVNPNEIK